MAHINFSLDGTAWTLTTDHPRSSYGQPVLVSDDGRVFGSADVVNEADADSIFGIPTTGMTIVGDALTERLVNKADPLVTSFLR